jgi:sugar phosphate isomerase/epimerase
MKMLESFPFPLSYQTEYRDETSLVKLLDLMQELGFANLEINIPDLAAISPARLRILLDEHEMDIKWLATGRFAQTRGLSLSDPDSQRRRMAIEGCIRNMEYAGELDAGIILGMFKSSPKKEKNPFPELFEDSLVKAATAMPQVPILLEATNPQSSTIINRVEEAAALIEKLNLQNLYLLPDTYHLALQDEAIPETLLAYQDHIPHIHFSDDNRFLPGYGSIDFAKVIKGLKADSYTGTIALEGKIKNSIEEDLRYSAKFLAESCE